MGKFFPLVAALAAGLALAAQGAINSELSRHTGRFRAVLTSLLVSLTTVALILLLRPDEGSLRGLAHAPRWAVFTGGILGVVVLVANVVAVPRIGAAATSGLIVVAQLIAAAAIDRFGLFNVAARPLTPGRLGGLVLLVLAVILIIRA
jgi:transporter family-2 protein